MTTKIFSNLKRQITRSNLAKFQHQKRITRHFMANHIYQPPLVDFMGPGVSTPQKRPHRNRLPPSWPENHLESYSIDMWEVKNANENFSLGGINPLICLDKKEKSAFWKFFNLRNHNFSCMNPFNRICPRFSFFGGRGYIVPHTNLSQGKPVMKGTWRDNFFYNVIHSEVTSSKWRIFTENAVFLKN